MAFYALNSPSDIMAPGAMSQFSITAYDGPILVVGTNGPVLGREIQNPTKEEVEQYKPYFDPSLERRVTDPRELVSAGEFLGIPVESLGAMSGTPQEPITTEANRDRDQEKKDYQEGGANQDEEDYQEGGLDDPDVIKDILENPEVEELVEAKLAAGKEKDTDKNGNPISTPLTSGLGFSSNPAVRGDLFPSGRNYGVTSLMGGRSPDYGLGSRLTGSSRSGAYPRDINGNTLPWDDSIPDTDEEAVGYLPGSGLPGEGEGSDEDGDGDGAEKTFLELGSDWYADKNQFTYIFGGPWTNPPPSDKTTAWSDPVTGSTYTGHQKDRDIFGFPSSQSGFTWQNFSEELDISDWDTGKVGTPADLVGTIRPSSLTPMEWFLSSNQITFPTEDEFNPDNPLFRGTTDYDDNLLRAHTTPWTYYDQGRDLQEFFASPFDPQYSLGHSYGHRTDLGTGYQDGQILYPDAFNNIYDTSGPNENLRGLDVGQVQDMYSGDTNRQFRTMNPVIENSYMLQPEYNWWDWEAEENKPYYQFLNRDDYGDRQIVGTDGQLLDETWNGWLDGGGSLANFDEQTSAKDFMPTTPGNEMFDVVLGWLGDQGLSFNPPPWMPGHNEDLDILGRPADGTAGSLTWYDFAESNGLDPTTGVPTSGMYNEDTGWEDWGGFQDKLTLESLGFGIPDPEAPGPEGPGPEGPGDITSWTVSRDQWGIIKWLIDDPATVQEFLADEGGIDTYRTLVQLGLIDPNVITQDFYTDPGNGIHNWLKSGADDSYKWLKVLVDRGGLVFDWDTATDDPWLVEGVDQSTNPVDETYWDLSSEQIQTLAGWYTDPVGLENWQEDTNGDNTYTYLHESGFLDPNLISLEWFQRNIWPTFNPTNPNGLLELIGSGTVRPDGKPYEVENSASQKKNNNAARNANTTTNADTSSMMQTALQEEQPINSLRNREPCLLWTLAGNLEKILLGRCLDKQRIPPRISAPCKILVL